MDAPTEGEHKGLLRRSYRTGGWPPVQAVLAHDCFFCHHCGFVAGAQWGRRAKHTLLTDFGPVWSSQGPAERSTPSNPKGKQRAARERHDQDTAWSLGATRGCEQEGHHHVSWDCMKTLHNSPLAFQPASIYLKKRNWRDFLGPQTSPCIFCNKIPYLDLARSKLT